MAETLAGQATPGPWSFNAEDSTIRALSPDALRQWGLMGDYRGCIVAYVASNPAVHRDTGPDRRRIAANAALLASAPDLKAAAEAAYSYIADTCGVDAAAVVAQLQTALNKAEGQD
jgi:hypothetical protein